MPIDPFALPGSELLKPSMNPFGTLPKKEILASSGGGGGGRSKKPAPAPVEEPGEERIPEAAPAPKPQEPPVKLSNAKWGMGEACFGDTVTATVDIALPETHAHLTRVSFTLLRLNEKGRKETVTTAYFHAKDGRVEGGFKLEPPAGPAPAGPVPYFFSARHRDSKEAESGELKVAAPLRTLVCEFDDHSELKKPGHTLVLKDAGGAVHSRLKFEDGKDEGGIASFEFADLDAETGYILEIQNGEGRPVEVFFSETKHSDWKLDSETKDP